MLSEVDISNMALSMLGAKAQVASLDVTDGSVEAGLCATFLPTARRLTIENGTFPFTYKREVLAELLSHGSRMWAHAYSLPADCLIPMRIINHNYTSKAALFLAPDRAIGVAGMLNEGSGSDFYWEDSHIYTNEPDAILLYKRDLTDPRYYTPGFELSVAMALAGLLAGPIIGGADGARIGASWSERASQQAKIASASAANASQSTTAHTPSWMAQR